MVVDRVEYDAAIQAPIERVWAAVTQPEHLAVWYAFGGAEVDLWPGGAMVYRWDEHGVFHGRVEQVEPPHRFSYRLALNPGEQPHGGNATHVEFTLTPDGAATRFRVVERGFAALGASEDAREEQVAASKGAWAAGLNQLEQYAPQVAG